MRRRRRPQLLAALRHYQRRQRRARPEQLHEPRLFARALPRHQRHSNGLTAMLTREQSQQLAARALKLSTFPECAVNLVEEERAVIRFANNGVTTAGFTVGRTVAVSSSRDGRTGRSETTELDDAALEAAVRRSESLAAVAPPNPERMPPLGPQQ